MESVVALFSEPAQARATLEALLARGYHRDNLAFSMMDVTEEEAIASETGVSPEEGAPAGVGAMLRGAGTGILYGLALTTPVWLLLLIIPVTRIYQEGGLFGMLFGVLGGAGMGAAFGALAGTDNGDYVTLLRQFGMPARVAEAYETSMREGNVLVIARAQQDLLSDEAIEVFKEHGALDLDAARGSGRLGSQRATTGH